MNNAELINRLRDVPCWAIGTETEEVMYDAADLIEAQAKRIEELNTKCDDLQSHINSMESEIEELLPKEGEWVWLSSTYDRVPCEVRYWCSVCHHEETTYNGCKPLHKYCPNCGARMKGEQE